MKRSLSEAELSDCDDDVFDEDRIKAGSPSQSCSVTDRKKRRGIIEKRRRDRINNSLIELRRLVPSAFEKQVGDTGSAKLEKAEILQMTVDHLKLLHQKGLNGNYYDPHGLAMDYRTVGYRECAAEVARYLVTVEGLDIQDPLRLRLMSHLQCFSSQRELAAKGCQNATNAWQTTNGHYTTSPNNMIQHQQQEQMTSLPTMTSCADTRVQSHHQEMSHVRVPTTHGTSMPPHHVPVSSTQISHSQTLLAPPPISQLSQVNSQYQLTTGMNGMTHVLSPNNYSPPTSVSQTLNLKQPYRPWGSELVGY